MPNEDLENIAGRWLRVEHRLTALETKFWIILALLLSNFGLGVLNLIRGR